MWQYKIMIGIPIGMIGMIFYKHFPQDSQDWASWVQAIGAVMTLGFAVWLLHHEQQQSKKQELKDTHNALRAIESEMWTFINTGQVIQQDYVKAKMSGAVKIYPPQSVEFPVFNGLVAFLPKMDGEHLRVSVIAAYANLRSLFVTVNAISDAGRRVDLLSHKDKDLHAEIEGYVNKIPKVLENLLSDHQVVKDAIAAFED